ncbi:MAG: hypothetical protein ACTS3F_12740, partial [Phycisphaerales bacterium]
MEPRCRIVRLGTTGSTMDEARSLCAALLDDARRGGRDALDALRDGVLITAEVQTAGRGQPGRRWESPRGALMGTYLRGMVRGCGGEDDGGGARMVGMGMGVGALALRCALEVLGLVSSWLPEAEGARGMEGSRGAVGAVESKPAGMSGSVG